MATYKIIMSTIALIALVTLGYLEIKLDWYVYTTLIGVIFGANIDDIKEILSVYLGKKGNK